MRAGLNVTPIKPLAFLAGGGEMGERIRSFSWSGTSLGVPERWPSGLRTSLRTLLTTQHPLFIFWGPELLCFYNDAYSRSLGPEKHPSILGLQGKVAWPEIWEIIGPQIDQVMRGDTATWHENQLIPILRHGELQEVYWTYSYGPIDEPSAPQGVGGVLVICTETTQQVLAERHINEERARFAQLFELTPTFMCVLRGPSHVFEMANPGYLRLTGHRPLIGRPLAEALPEAVEQGYLKLLDEAYASGTPFSASGASYAAPARPGEAPSAHCVDFVFQPIKDAEGKVSGIFCEGVDVTNRALAESALREADRRKDDFLAMLAHELRNPLAPISTAAELLARRIEGDDTARAAADVVRRQTAQLTRLVDDLLDVSRISMGRIDLRSDTLLLSHVIDQAAETAASLWRAKQQDVSFVTSLEPLYVKGDLTRLVQCFGNVMTNAAKYTEAGGRISIHVIGADDVVRVEITDTGAGICPEFLPRIFDLFAQADYTLNRSQGGLGIGLSVVKKLVDMHGGSISARSDGVGRGSTFEIILPRAQPPACEAPGSRRASVIVRRILIVDDNADSANSLSELLRMDGHQTQTAFSAEDALSLAESYDPDVVMLDIGLPRMDGFEVARRMRHSLVRKGARLIAVTGHGRSEDRERTKAAGFDAHFIKPLDLRSLERFLADIKP